MRDANQQDWSQDCKTLAMTQHDLNNLPKWLDENAGHKTRTNDGDLGGTPTRLNFKQSVAFGLIIRRYNRNVKVHGQNNDQQLLLNISGACSRNTQ